MRELNDNEIQNVNGGFLFGKGLSLSGSISSGLNLIGGLFGLNFSAGFKVSSGSHETCRPKGHTGIDPNMLVPVISLKSSGK